MTVSARTRWPAVSPVLDRRKTTRFDLKKDEGLTLTRLVVRCRHQRILRRIFLLLSWGCPAHMNTLAGVSVALRGGYRLGSGGVVGQSAVNGRGVERDHPEPADQVFASAAFTPCFFDADLRALVKARDA